MSPEDIVGVVGLLAVAFGRDTSAETFEVFEAALVDLEVPDPRALVLDLLRSMDRWPSPAALRREILDAAGLLPLDEDEAFQMALAYSRNPDRVEIPAPVQEALQTIGGVWSLRTGIQGVVLAQFRDAYRLSRGRHVKEALTRSYKGLPINPRREVGLRYGGRDLGRGQDSAPRGDAEG